MAFFQQCKKESTCADDVQVAMIFFFNKLYLKKNCELVKKKGNLLNKIFYKSNFWSLLGQFQYIE